MTAIDTPLASALADRYRIDRELGSGGMAVVYLAHDLKHDRRVALKVLRHELAAVIGAERFLAEIKLTANLQHPHILPLHDSGEADGTVFYVMPYVDGESLRDRLVREKQLPVEEAVRIAREVAGALDYAHRRDVIHRDIKPENILLHDGQALVADFGIALAAAKTGAARMTETGMSLGTPTYMSPEQAMGERSLDARSDVYALGCVVYEMLTGEPPFTGPTAQAIVARVMTDTPRPMRVQRHTIPPNVEAAVSRALEKLPADRFVSAADFSAALIDASFRPAGEPLAASVQGASRSRPPLVYTLAAVSVALAALAAWGWLRKPAPGRVMRFDVAVASSIVEAYTSGPDVPAISPDGRRFVYTGYDGRLLVRDESDRKPVPLAGTENAWSPAFSRDGSSIAYIVGFPGDLKVAPLTGGSPVTLVHDSAWANGVAWSEDGWIYYPSERGVALMRVRTSGGASELVARADTAKDELFFMWPSSIDGGRSLVFTIWRRRGTPDIAAMDLATKHVRVLMGGVRPLPTTMGLLLVLQGDGTLAGVPFDARRLAIDGQPKPLIEGLRVPQGGRTLLAVSANGTLLYDGYKPIHDIVRVTRDGVATPVDSSWRGDFTDVALSPDGSRLAVSMTTNQGRDEIWVKTLDNGPLTRVASSGSRNARPAWLADGRSISFTSDVGANYDLYQASADGAGPMQHVFAFNRSVDEATWSRDGKWLVFRAGSGGGRHIYRFHLGVDSDPHPIVTTEFEEYSPSLSPDGRWLAYTSTASGKDEVYVVPFPNTDGAKVQVSPAGGVEPLWSNSGRELFYRSPTGDLVAAAVDAGSSLRVTTRRVLFSAKDYLTDNRNRDYAVSPDDRSFYFVRSRTASPTSIMIVLNWFEELKAKMGQ